MLNCNVIDELYSFIKKEQLGLCVNDTTLLSIAHKQLRLNLGCSGVVLCYTPETCVGSTTTSCNLSITQTLSITSCNLVITQSFDDP